MVIVAIYNYSCKLIVNLIPFERHYSPNVVPLASLLDLAVSAVARLAQSFLSLHLKLDQRVYIYKIQFLTCTYSERV